MLKRGQLSIFILLGVVLVIAVSVTLYRQPVAQIPVPVEPLSAIEGLLHSCWDEQDVSDIRRLGVQGGVASPNFGLYQGLVTTQYAVRDGRVILGNQSDLEEELATLVSASHSGCEEDILDNATQYGVGITPGPETVAVLIGDTSVTVRTTPTTRLTLGETSRVVQPRVHTIPTKFGTLFNTAQTLTARVAANPDVIDVLPTLDEANVRIAAIGSGYVVALSDLNAEEPSVFWLAFDNGETRRLSIANGPDVEQPSPVKVKAGETFSGIIVASDPQGGPLLFQTDSQLMLLDPDGGAYLISATSFDVGMHDVPIDVYTADGGHKRVILEVIVQ